MLPNLSILFWVIAKLVSIQTKKMLKLGKLFFFMKLVNR